ncbi:MAG: 4-oxalocrotonate tautomerase family protein [SAR324 cluster bacterium]|nr:4-oxalocrotonate tautomerase family protein [SAR324 cluster bacterium]
MPLVTIKMIEGRTPEQKESAARAITDILVKHCDAHREHIYVVFEDVADSDWLVGGVTVRQRKNERGGS